MLSSWLDNPENGAEFGSAECQSDLLRLARLRRTIAQALSGKDMYDEGVEVLSEFHEYFSCLKECEGRGFPSMSEHGSNRNQRAQIHNTHFQLEWESALSSVWETHSNLTWERANILWNIVTLEAYLASKQSLDSKIGWSKAAQHFQNAGCLLSHLLDLLQQQSASLSPSEGPSASLSTSIDFSPSFLKLWQAMLVAQSQRCVYESLACAPRPRHLLVAKLAAAAVPLFHECEKLVQDEILNQEIPSLTSNWADYCRAWGIFMSCKAESHQASLHREKKQWGLELARLDLSFRFAKLCREFCESAPVMALQSLHQQVELTLDDLKQRVDVAEEENSEVHNKPVPERRELPEIRGERLVNVDQPLDKVIKPLQKPLFTTLLSPDIRRYVDLFRTEMDKLVFQMASVAEERTESARKALATVNLPHSLTAYRQEQSGGGIPDDLWERVQNIQRERRISQLKQDLWGLRDVAEQARTTYKRVESQLDFDLESDRLFRQSNPGFEGHDAVEVQKTFRQSLSNYDRLLVTAQEGDSVLLRRLEILDTNPKYKLLQFQKSQLDRLLPGAGSTGDQHTSGCGSGAIDTSHLSRLLVELSALFHEREVLLNTIKEEVKSFDIRASLAQVDPLSPTGDQDYRDSLAYAQKSFDGIVFEMQANIEKQTGLVNKILAENEQFMQARARSQSTHSSSDSCIVMIEDAIEEIEQLSKHLKEGRDFYDVVIPKLEKLKQQVGDVSARLTVERLEYDDKANRNRQEEEDAMIAKRMSENPDGSNSNPDVPGRMASATSRSAEGGVALARPDFARVPSQPGFAQVAHDQPQVSVDDEKVATLVAMEFDPAKVVAALKKYDNNMDQALNDLLSS